MNVLTAALLLGMSVIPVSAAIEEDTEQNVSPVRLLSFATLGDQTSEIDSKVSYDILFAEIEYFRNSLLNKHSNQH